MISGIPQLIKIYFNDSPSDLQTDCLISADDLKLWLVVSKVDDADLLQTTLDQLHCWLME